MGRQAAVIGSPVAHSLSPVLHNAAFEALGLTSWSYTRIECVANDVPALVHGLDESWAGLSVTMPNKRAALAVASVPTSRASLVGAANTLVPSEAGWVADCTDVDGVVGALRANGFTTGSTALLLGAGGTATAALVGLASVGVRSATLVVRSTARAGEAVDCAVRAGVELTLVPWHEADFGALASTSDVLVSTVPPAATEPVADELALAPFALDVIYHPWPTPLALAVGKRGNALATGLDMLLHQAFGQSEQFTGRPAPREAMRAALRAATGDLLPLPL
ncbi:shikimate dehydrogenase [Actinosynnema sp. NPDC020468]|uniref:shikimate dehydrogenase n=1 Tax=Actinosynnema sp. NPDC020468 TaxID=3154488 RepID=UPI0033D0E627